MVEARMNDADGTGSGFQTKVMKGIMCGAGNFLVNPEESDVPVVEILDDERVES